MGFSPIRLTNTQGFVFSPTRSTLKEGRRLALPDHIWGSTREKTEGRSHAFSYNSKDRDRMDEECAAWGRKGYQMYLPG